MVGKLHKSEAWKQSDPDRPGLLLHLRYLSRDSIRIHRIPAELLHSSKLGLRNTIGPRRILPELPCSSYDVGSRQSGRPSGPQSLTTLPTRPRQATTLRIEPFQVESPKCGVCVNFHHEGCIYRGEWDIHHLGEVGLVIGGGRAAKPFGRSVEWSGFHRLSSLTQASPPCAEAWQPCFRSNRLKLWPTGQPAPEPTQPGVWPQLVHVSNTPLW
jgi:hypothetical protein